MYVVGLLPLAYTCSPLRKEEKVIALRPEAEGSAG